MTPDDIRAAAGRLHGHAVRTPLLTSPLLDEAAGRRVFVKAECLQRTGSFKYRGARNAIAALDETERSRGVLAYSSGNHGQGIACAAREFGVPASIVMPADVARTKLDNCRAYGAEVVTYDRATDSREALGARLAEEQGLTLIRPFDNGDVIAGQGTVGLELAEQAAALGVAPNADVLVCCGGGGLTAGIALALAEAAPDATVRPVEPEGFDDVARSLARGKVEPNSGEATSICDAILTPSPGVLTFPIMKDHCGPGITVSDEDALRAVALAWRHLKIVVEPGGAVSLAAALLGDDDRDVVAIASGGNVDAEVFARALDML